ncbi:MAG: type II secretion system protein N [Woeseiaceae bacterium]
MRSRMRLILVAVATFLLGVVLLFPARVAYHLLPEGLVAASGVEGTVWRGRVSALSSNGIYVSNVSWRFRPMRLLSGELAYAMKADVMSGFVTTDVGFGFGGKVRLRDLNAAIPAQLLQSSLNLPGLTGSIAATFERLSFDGDLPVAADGNVEIINLVAPRVFRGALGGYKAEFFTQNNGIGASVEDTDGIVDVAGSLTITADRNYQFIGQIAPKENTPANMRQQLRVLGSPDERGQYPMRLEGVL